jgi:hypothetical protein
VVPPAPASAGAEAPPAPDLLSLAEGARRLALVQQARALRAAGLGWVETGKRLGVPFPTLFKWCARVEGIAQPTAEHLATRKARGRAQRAPLEGKDKAALQAAYLVTNRTADAGSSPHLSFA